MRRHPLCSRYSTDYGPVQPRVFGHGAEAEFRQLRLAQGHQPGAQHHPGYLAVGDGRVWFPRVGAMHRRLSGNVDVVLDEGRHSTEERFVARTHRGRVSRHVESRIRQRVQCRVNGFGAGDGGLDDVCPTHST